jgi:hypothetical protein
MVDSELDLLPEEIDWRDEGCAVFSSCLSCPLPRCVEEEPRGQQRLRLAARNKRMVELRQGGKSVKEIAGLFGVSKRTVERALRAKSACHSERSEESHVIPITEIATSFSGRTRNDRRGGLRMTFSHVSSRGAKRRGDLKTSLSLRGEAWQSRR